MPNFYLKSSRAACNWLWKSGKSKPRMDWRMVKLHLMINHMHCKEINTGKQMSHAERLIILNPSEDFFSRFFICYLFGLATLSQEIGFIMILWRLIRLESAC